MTALTDRCDASPSGTERAVVTWLRLGDDLELRLCLHHSARHSPKLHDAGFVPIPDDMTTTLTKDGASALHDDRMDPAGLPTVRSDEEGTDPEGYPFHYP